MIRWWHRPNLDQATNLIPSRPFPLQHRVFIHFGQIDTRLSIVTAVAFHAVPFEEWLEFLIPKTDLIGRGCCAGSLGRRSHRRLGIRRLILSNQGAASEQHSQRKRPAADLDSQPAQRSSGVGRFQRWLSYHRRANHRREWRQESLRNNTLDSPPSWRIGNIDQIPQSKSQIWSAPDGVNCRSRGVQRISLSYCVRGCLRKVCPLLAARTRLVFAPISIDAPHPCRLVGQGAQRRPVTDLGTPGRPLIDARSRLRLS
jgi:hypothetical protein